MNRTITTLFVIGVLLLMVVAPFSALAMLMMFLFAAGVIWFVSTLVQVVIGQEPRSFGASRSESHLSQPSNSDS